MSLLPRCSLSLSALLICWSLPLAAIELSVLDPCSSTPWVKMSLEGGQGQSVLELTSKALNQAGLPFVSAGNGLYSVRSTPTGDAAIEILSDEEMRAYGWCYKVNGTFIEVLASDWLLKDSSDQIVWVYSYAHYRRGVWLSYCEAASQIKPKFLCQN